MQVPENAELTDLTIQGLGFKAPIVVHPSDFKKSIEPVCNPDMASKILQQTFIENWRNNYAPKVKAAVLKVAKENGSEATKVSDIDDETAQVVFDAINGSEIHVQLQTGLDDYIAEYEPGVRRAATGESLSPVDRETKKLSLELVRDHLERTMNIGRTARSETFKEWDKKVQDELGITGAAHIENLAAELVEKNPKIRETAEANVAARKNLASGIDLSF